MIFSRADADFLLDNLDRTFGELHWRG